MQQGRPFSLMDATQGTNVCLIEPALQDKLQLDKECVGQTIQVGSRTFVIVGLLEPRVERHVRRPADQGRSFTIYAPFNTVYRITQNMTNVVAIRLGRPSSRKRRARRLRFFLRKERRLTFDEPDNFRLQAVEEIMRKFDEVAIVITMVAGGIVAISLLVGGVGIMNIMLVSVSERTREIGLRKAVGAPPSAILLQFLVEAVTLCLVGGLIGLLFGQLLTSPSWRPSPRPSRRQRRNGADPGGDPALGRRAGVRVLGPRRHRLRHVPGHQGGAAGPDGSPAT